MPSQPKIAPMQRFLPPQSINEAPLVTPSARRLAPEIETFAPPESPFSTHALWRVRPKTVLPPVYVTVSFFAVIWPQVHFVVMPDLHTTVPTRPSVKPLVVMMPPFDGLVST